MCPPAIGATPSQNPFLGLDLQKTVDAPKGDQVQGLAKSGNAAAANNVKFGGVVGNAAGSAAPKAAASLTAPAALPSDGGKISASTQRLVDMAIAETKDGPAASFLAKVMLKNAGEQRDQAMRDMMAARQNAYSLNLQAAGDLKKSGSNLQGAALTSLGLSLAGSVFHFGNTSHRKAEEGSKAAVLGNSFQGAGQYASSSGESQAKGAEADQKTDEANAQQAEMVADRKKDTVDKIEELTKQVLDFLHDFQETNNDMMAAITRA